MDAFPLPVEGTETRVNAGAGANEFMVTFTETCERIGPSTCHGRIYPPVGQPKKAKWIRLEKCVYSQMITDEIPYNYSRQ